MSRPLLVVTAVVLALLLVVAFVAGGYSLQGIAPGNPGVRPLAQLCVPDALEPNNTAATAVTITAGTHGSLSVCPTSDEDFFRLPVPGGYRVAAEIFYDSPSGDLNLSLLDSNGSRVLDQNNSAGNYEAVSGTPVTTSVYLQVAGNQPSDTNSYTLTVRLWCEHCITYQGRLRDGSGPLNGTYDVHFELFAAPVGDSPLGQPYSNTLAVVDGLLTARLDLGPTPELFTGAQRYLEIRVRESGAPTYTLLSPRQPLSPAPAAHSAPWVGLSGVPQSLLDGDQGWPERALPPQANLLSLHYSNSTFSTADESTSVTIGADGFPIVAYADDQAVLVAHCHSTDCHTSSHLQIELNGQWPSIALGADGLPVIAYYESVGADLKIAHCNDVECGSASVVAVDSLGDAGKYPSITIGADGNPIISYIARSVLHSAHCGDAGCTTAVTKTISTLVQGTTPGETAITVLRNGQPFIAYAFMPYLLGVYCSDLDCDQFSSDLIYPTAAYNYLGGLDVTTGVDGWPIISWYTSPLNGERGFSVSHCPWQRPCTTTAIAGFFSNDTTLDSGITIGRDGLPIISYYYDDSNNPQPSELRAAFCETLSCTKVITMTVAAPSVGNYEPGKGNAITIGTDESPFFSYIGPHPVQLATLHCANPLCIPFLRRR